MKYIKFIILAMISTSAFAFSDCETHNMCRIDTPCECRIPATSAYDRFFYLNFPEIKKGHIYQCSFQDSLGIISAVLDKSTFPVGSSWQLQSTTPHFPINIMVDTNYMDKDVDQVIIKYFVPGSDMPTNVLGNCITVA